MAASAGGEASALNVEEKQDTITKPTEDCPAETIPADMDTKDNNGKEDSVADMESASGRKELEQERIEDDERQKATTTSEQCAEKDPELKEQQGGESKSSKSETDKTQDVESEKESLERTEEGKKDVVDKEEKMEEGRSMEEVKTADVQSEQEEELEKVGSKEEPKMDSVSITEQVSGSVKSNVAEKEDVGKSTESEDVETVMSSSVHRTEDMKKDDGKDEVEESLEVDENQSLSMSAISEQTSSNLPTETENKDTAKIVEDQTPDESNSNLYQRLETESRPFSEQVSQSQSIGGFGQIEPEVTGTGIISDDSNPVQSMDADDNAVDVDLSERIQLKLHKVKVVGPVDTSQPGIDTKDGDGEVVDEGKEGDGQKERDDEEGKQGPEEDDGEPPAKRKRDADENGTDETAAENGADDTQENGADENVENIVEPTPSNTDAELGLVMPAQNVFEYQWPQDGGGEWFFVQEQISEYLGVTSFKRKYPDIERRVMAIKEKDFLRERGVVTEEQVTLGLTALKSDDIYDLMMKEYPDKYRDYIKIMREKEQQSIKERNKNYGKPVCDASKMKEYLKKAAKQAADYNSMFMKERREERQYYFDMQTLTVQVPANKMRKLNKEYTKPGPYPVALIPGQFQNYYRQYTSEELKYFPISTALYGPASPRRQDHYARTTGDQDAASDDESIPVSLSGDDSTGMDSGSSGSSSDSGSSSEGEEGDEADGAELPLPLQPPKEGREVPMEEQPKQPAYVPKKIPDAICGLCLKDKASNKKGDPEELVHCSQCDNSGHPSCLEMTEALVKVILSYPWQCMECKTCMHCGDPTHEDKMMFCDDCDRGYHTFCVGLKDIPTGKWACASCTTPSNTTVTLTTAQLPLEQATLEPVQDATATTATTTSSTEPESTATESPAPESAAESGAEVTPTKPPPGKRPRGRPPGSKNKEKKDKGTPKEKKTPKVKKEKNKDGTPASEKKSKKKLKIPSDDKDTPQKSPAAASEEKEKDSQEDSPMDTTTADDSAVSESAATGGEEKGEEKKEELKKAEEKKGKVKKGEVTPKVKRPRGRPPRTDKDTPVSSTKKKGPAKEKVADSLSSESDVSDDEDVSSSKRSKKRKDDITSNDKEEQDPSEGETEEIVSKKPRGRPPKKDKGTPSSKHRDVPLENTQTPTHLKDEEVFEQPLDMAEQNTANSSLAASGKRPRGRPSLKGQIPSPLPQAGGDEATDEPVPQERLKDSTPKTTSKRPRGRPPKTDTPKSARKALTPDKPPEASESTKSSYYSVLLKALQAGDGNSTPTDDASVDSDSASSRAATPTGKRGPGRPKKDKTTSESPKPQAKKRKTDTPTPGDEKADDTDATSKKSEDADATTKTSDDADATTKKSEEDKLTEKSASSPSTKDAESSIKEDAAAGTEANPSEDQATPVKKRRGRPPKKDKDTPTSSSAKKVKRPRKKGGEGDADKAADGETPGTPAGATPGTLAGASGDTKADDEEKSTPTVRAKKPRGRPPRKDKDTPSSARKAKKQLQPEETIEATPTPEQPQLERLQQETPVESPATTNQDSEAVSESISSEQTPDVTPSPTPDVQDIVATEAKKLGEDDASKTTPSGSEVETSELVRKEDSVRKEDLGVSKTVVSEEQQVSEPQEEPMELTATEPKVSSVTNSSTSLETVTESKKPNTASDPAVIPMETDEAVSSHVPTTGDAQGTASEPSAANE